MSFILTPVSHACRLSSPGAAIVSPLVDVITVLWNSARFLPELFAGLVETDYPRELWRMHFVDNNPGDGSLDEVRRLLKIHEGALPEIIIHQPATNTGFSGGNNLVMRQVIEQGRDFVYLHNHDARFEPSGLREAITVAQTDANIGSVQSLMVLMDRPEVVNSRGNSIHFLGHGYCQGYLEPRASVPDQIEEIAYASGGGVLLSVLALKRVGLLDETLWLYHEDLDLGWRLRLGGFRNVLAPRSVLRHRYEFSRSRSKWFWMERNRLAVVIKNYRLGTIFLCLPGLIAVEVATWIFAMIGGWGKDKARAFAWLFKPSTWTYLRKGRLEIARMRMRSDQEILTHFASGIEFQGIATPFLTKIANPLMKIYFTVLMWFVRW